MLAANASGPRRRALGAPHDRILGARFVTGDGTTARTGGRVVKNVAGHAVHRLLVGSRGTLGVILEASLKLLPQPTGRVAWAWGADAAALADAKRWSAWPRREPAVLSVIGRAVAAKHPVLACDAPFALVAGFEDDPAWLAACDTFAHDTLGVPRLTRRDGDVPALWQQLTDLEERLGARLTFTSAHLAPDAVSFLAGRPVAERLVFHAACGRLHLWPDEGEAAGLVRELVERGFMLTEARGVPAATAEAPGIELVRDRIREALDPSGVWALGHREM